MTDFLFRDDAYLTEAVATVTAAGPEGIELHRTLFYASSGGQPGDTGVLIRADGRENVVTRTFHPDGDRSRALHLTEPSAPLPTRGEAVTLRLDWDRRYRLMRMHTALHLLSVGLPYAVTGGQIGEDKGRLDFDMPEPPENVARIEARLNAWVSAGLPVTAEWITDAELAARPEIVKTMKVKPPIGQGRVRLVRIGTGAETIDLQPRRDPRSFDRRDRLTPHRQDREEGPREPARLSSLRQLTPMNKGPMALYRRMVADGDLAADPAQRLAVEKLQLLAMRLADYNPAAPKRVGTGLFGRAGTDLSISPCPAFISTVASDAASRC